MVEHGTFLITRAVFDHDAFAPEPFTEREAWLWLISAAEWTTKKRKSGRHIVDVHRGQLSHSLRFLGKKWRWHYSTVRVFLNKLARLNMIETTTATGQNLITIVNYSTYQNSPASQ